MPKLNPFLRRLSLPGLLFVVAGWSALPISDASAAAPEAPLNVVILYADDWRHDTLGCAGNPVVLTPRIDALAREGLRFTNSFVTTSICGVSRATLLTGQWMSRHGNRAFEMFRTPWAETYPAQLRARGYWVGHVGKWHNGQFPADQYDFGRGTITPMRHWLKQPDGTEIHVTRKNEGDAMQFLRERPAGRPFCLTVAFVATHAEDQNPKQYLPQPESLALYRDVQVPLPRTATEEHFRRLPSFLANDRNEGRNRWKWRFDTPEKYQEFMKNYFRLATEADAACGRLVDELRRQGVLDRTLVIFTADNGYFHGEHGLADKWYPHEESIRVPLIVRDPRLPATRRGATEAAFALNVDLAPTILGAAGIVSPRGMQGRDLAALYPAGEPANWRREFFYEHGVIRSADFIPASEALVRREWKYMFWPDHGREQLFHLAVDPGEEHDVVAAPVHASVLAEMRARFLQLKAAAGAPM
jgi:arylsulfatase A-like enzyme